MDTIDEATIEATPVDATPPAKQRKRRWWQRHDRKGLGTTELTILILVIVMVGLLSGLGITMVMSARSGAEHSALKSNINTVSSFVDTYWNSYASDSDGRRKITPFRLCDYLNSQLGGDDLNIRTLQLVEAGAAADAPLALTATAPGPEFAVNIGTVPNAAAEANCPSTLSRLGTDLYADIVVGGATTAIAVADWEATGAAAKTAAMTSTDGARQTELEQVGLLSTQTVWIAQYGTSGTAGANGFDATGVTGNLPDGTDGKFDTAGGNATAAGAEYIVLGGVAPDGTSFCMIKVLDAANNEDLGDYYLARAPQEGTNAANTFTLCVEGVDPAFGDPNEMSRGSWPEPR